MKTQLTTMIAILVSCMLMAGPVNAQLDGSYGDYNDEDVNVLELSPMRFGQCEVCLNQANDDELDRFRGCLKASYPNRTNRTQGQCEKKSADQFIADARACTYTDTRVVPFKSENCGWVSGPKARPDRTKIDKHTDELLNDPDGNNGESIDF